MFPFLGHREVRRRPQVSKTLARAIRSGAKGGFTLVEILIVVVILGILAGIVLPQFSNASSVARENILKDDLRYLRTQIVVYKAQHQDVSPGVLNGAASASTFVDQMMLYTDVNGQTSSASSATYCYGPYLQRMPPNPLTGQTDIKIISGGAAAVPDDSTGWIYNPSTQEIIVNSTHSDQSGTPYAQY